MFTTKTSAMPPRRQHSGIDIDVGCSFVFDLAVATHAVVMVEPRPEEVVTRSQFDVEPSTASAVHLDPFGNVCRRITLPAGRVALHFGALVAVADIADPVVPDAAHVQPAALPAAVLPFLLPSRYCESDRVADLAFSEFGAVAPGWQRVQAISDWVHGSISFGYGSSSPSLSAIGALESRTGVCRDFAHVAIALCRAMNIAARYVFGYLPDIGVRDPGTPMDFCAWMEVYLGDGWHTFDPRNNQRRAGRVVIGRGRDAADVAMVTSFGRADLVSLDVRAAPVGRAA